MNTGDVMQDLETGEYILIGESSTVIEEDKEIDTFWVFPFALQCWTWYYACFLEDELLYRKVA